MRARARSVYMSQSQSQSLPALCISPSKLVTDADKQEMTQALGVILEKLRADDHLTEDLAVIVESIKQLDELQIPRVQDVINTYYDTTDKWWKILSRINGQITQLPHSIDNSPQMAQISEFMERVQGR